MKYIRAKAGFIRYSDDALVVAALRIIRCLKDSPYFTDPTPSLVELEESYVDYYDKVLQAKGGGLIYNSAKRESKRKLAAQLQKLVFYINIVSDGDLVKLHSSGFPVLEKKRKGHLPAIPEGPYLLDGRVSGEVAFGFKPVGRDMLYDYCFASTLDKKGNPIWGDIQTTSRSFRSYAGGFEPGKYVYFKVCAKNKHGISDWSIVVMLMVR
ncbi:hypothetical protein FAZ19_08725 [Sphingobacterium alkalisoli]|uniref:Fibronectin type III domain-containing protein n=1 Tax=Sphingobacterium alkalisoli TaxID=1874115 RepID=A0A4U0H920_9SPHI|nr:hypothetical protein [Sphingobacterium alkalisoli]TJY66972.1 hypothetical protein FAZ19_08725 [Sphingobacterium alkalisoli]GGH13059.1 hypothetical protein GCM10011418_13000 [Sphingobacterium alkalisoli]